MTKREEALHALWELVDGDNVDIDGQWLTDAIAAFERAVRDEEASAIIEQIQVHGPAGSTQAIQRRIAAREKP